MVYFSLWLPKRFLSKKRKAWERLLTAFSENRIAPCFLSSRKGRCSESRRENFHLIEREATDAGKEISVESVDENILAFAKNAGMTVGHPLLRERGVMGTSGISDIVPVVRLEKMHEVVGETGSEEQEAEESSRGKRRTGHKAPETKEDVVEDAGTARSVRTRRCSRRKNLFSRKRIAFSKSGHIIGRRGY